MIVPQNIMNVVPQNKMNVEGGVSGFTGTKVLAYWYKSTIKVLRLDAFPECKMALQCQMQSDSKAYCETVCTRIYACMHA